MSEADSKEEVVELNPSELAKKLGNEAYQAKKYDDAIKHYTEAINLDPESAVFYSNRSACYFALKQYQKAYEDALLCVSKDPQFIKGYYRLSSAQTELQMYDDSIATLKAALSIEPGNEVIIRQLKSVQAKKTGVVVNKEPKKPRKQLDEAQIKELQELQEQLNTYNRDLRGVRNKLATMQRESRMNQVTAEQIQGLKENIPLYRSVGKAFVFTERGDIQSRLENENVELNKNQRDLIDRQEYLERRIASNSSNLRDLTMDL